MLGFFKGLVGLILILALCVLALRQLETSRVISLGGLRDIIGQIVPIEPRSFPPPNWLSRPETAPAGDADQRPGS